MTEDFACECAARLVRDARSTRRSRMEDGVHKLIIVLLLYWPELEAEKFSEFIAQASKYMNKVPDGL